jgi:sugar phosphate isomerase/epimerase
MRLACSTRGLDLYPDRYGHSTPKTRARIFHWMRRAGFEAVEMEDRWCDAEAMSAAELAELRAAAADAGVALTLKLHYRDLHTPEIAAANEASVLRAIQVAEAVGAPIVSIGLPTPPSALDAVARRIGRPWNGSGADLPDEAFTRTAAALRRLADAAADVGIDLSIELHQGSIVDNSIRLLRLLDLVDYANVGANPDIANILQTLPPPGETWREAIERLAARANYWHVKNLRRIDIPGRSPFFIRRALHEGEIDYRWAVSVMQAAGFEGYVVIEGPGAGDHLRACEEGRMYIRYLLDENRRIYQE